MAVGEALPSALAEILRMMQGAQVPEFLQPTAAGPGAPQLPPMLGGGAQVSSDIPAGFSTAGMGPAPGPGLPPMPPPGAGGPPSAPPRPASVMPRSLAAAGAGAGAGPPMAPAGPPPGAGGAAGASPPDEYGPLLQQIREQRLGMSKDYEAASAPPDYRELQGQMAERRRAYLPGAMAAVLAGMGPQAGQVLQKGMMARADQAREPLKIEGGMITAEGEVMLDPAFQKQKKIESLQRRMEALDKLELNVISDRDKAAIAREKMATDAELKRQYLELRRDIAASKRGGGEGGQLNVNQRATIEDRMSDDYQRYVKPYQEELTQVNRIISLSESGRRLTGTDQQAMVFMLNKFLDPNSVVREGEFDRIVRMQGLADRAQNAVNRIARGEILTPRTLKDVTELARFYQGAAEAKVESYRTDWTDRANRRGLDPRNVVGPGQQAGTPARRAGDAGIDVGAALGAPQPTGPGPREPVRVSY